MAQSAKPRAIGLNHVALEVGNIEEALAFYGRLFAFELRGKSDTMAFIDLGDQFIALQKGRKQPADDGRHFGLVVDNKEAVRAASRLPALRRSRDRSLTSATRGATALRSSAMTIFNSPKPPTSSAAWV